MSHIIASGDEKVVTVDGIEKFVTPVVATRDTNDNAVLGVGYWVAEEKVLFLFDPLPSRLIHAWRAMQLLSHAKRIITHITLEACWCAFSSNVRSSDEEELIEVLRQDIGNDAHFDALVSEIAASAPPDMEIKGMLRMVYEKKVQCDLAEVRSAREHDSRTVEHLVVQIESQRERSLRARSEDVITLSRQNAQRKVSIPNRTAAPQNIWGRLPRFIAEHLKLPFTWRRTK